MKRTILLIFLILNTAVLFSEGLSKSQTEEDLIRFEKVEELYLAGDYEECKILVDSCIREYESGEIRIPKKTIARIYSLKALIAYAYRGEGEDYKEEIKDLFLKAIKLDMDIEIGDPSEVPPFMLKFFTDVKREYLHQFSRSERRISLGVLGALVIDPTVLNNPSLLQPGLTFGYNLSEALALGFDLRIPLTLPIWGSIRGQAGFLWYPSFKIGKFSTAMCCFYLFSLDNLITYTHSITISGQGEIITRSGLGFAVRAELLRLDLILGLTDPADLPDYTSTDFLGESFLRVVFANMSFYIFYAF